MNELMAEFDRLYQFDEASGALRQRDLRVEAVYDQEYVRSRYDQYSTTEAISKLRANIVEVFCPSSDNSVLDFGCGNGAFLRSMATRRWETFGMDVSGYPFERNSEIQVAESTLIPVDVVTFFDSLEHVPNPQAVLNNLKCRFVVISVPWLPSVAMDAQQFVESFMQWKHRRHGEHLWHFNPGTLMQMFENSGFNLLHYNNFEDRIRKPEGNRPNILTAIFQKRPIEQ